MRKNYRTTWRQQFARAIKSCVYKHTPAMNFHRVCAAYLTHLEKISIGATTLPTPNLGDIWWLVSTPKPGRFTPDKRPGIHCTEGWVDFAVGLDVFRKSHPKWGSNDGPSSQ